MKHPRLWRVIVLSLATGLSASELRAQVMSAPVRVSQLSPAFKYAETSVSAASTSPPKVIVGYQEKINGALNYAVSENGVAWPTAYRGFLAPSAQCGLPHDADPVTAAYGQDLWVGGQGLLATIGVARWNPISHTMGSTAAVSCGLSVDKPGLAVGPGPGGASMYAVWTGSPCTGVSSSVLRAKRSDGAIPGEPLNWQLSELLVGAGPDCAATGRGAAPVVLPSSAGALAGRIVVAHGRLNSSSDGETPWVLFSDTQGSSWSESITAGGQGHIITSAGNENINPAEGGHLPGTFVFHNFPSIAVDPTNPLRVFVAFAGRSSPTANNVDLYLALSRDGGTSFVTSDVLRITDTMLHETTLLGGNSPDQFMPAVTVDNTGGVNIMYYTTSNPDDETSDRVQLSPRVCRIRSFTESLSQPLMVWQLNQPFFVDVVPITSPQFVGDYNGATAAGCISWFSYTSTHQGSYAIYVTRLDACATVADTDTNGAIGVADGSLFTSAYLETAPPADTNHDGKVDLEDVLAFQQSVACGCNP